MIRLYGFLKSLKLALALILLLAIGSVGAVVVGEWVPPGTSIEAVAGRYGSAKAAWVDRLGLTHPYGSWWYLLLLGLLAANLTCCTVDRWRRTLSLLRRRAAPQEPDFFEGKDSTREVAREDGAACRQSLEHVLRGKGYRVSGRDWDGVHSLAAEKGIWGRLGGAITHLGLMLLLIGGIIASAGGLRQMAMLAPGDTTPIPGRSELLRLDRFWLEWTEDGQIKDYLSTLSVLSGDSVVVQKTIEVNHPLSYGGISFYQNTYRQDARSFEEVEIRLGMSGEDDEGGDILVLRPEGPVPVEGTDYTIEVADFAVDFKLDANGSVYSASSESRNPAVRLRLATTDGEEVADTWRFLRMPDFHGGEFGGLEVKFMGFKPAYRSGLEVVHNPGEPVIWAGFIVMSLGLLLAFSINHQTLWFAVIPLPDGRARILWRGRWQKYRDRMEREVGDLLQSGHAGEST